MALTLTIIIFVIVTGSIYVEPSNWSDFIPYGFGGNVRPAATARTHTVRHTLAEHSPVLFVCLFAGTVQGAGVVFFAYIGFDTVSSLCVIGEIAENPGERGR